MKAATCLGALCVLPAVLCAQGAPVTTLELGRDDDSAPAAERAHAARRAGQIERATLRARSVTVQGPWGRGVDVGIAPCALITRERIFAAMEALERAITREHAATAALASRGAAEVLLIQVDYDAQATTDVCDGQPAIGITFRPYHVRVDLEQIGNNVLPLPRSALAPLYAHEPAALRTLDPQVGMSRDKAFGTSLALRAATPIRMAAAHPQGTGNGGVRQTMDLDATRIQSIDHPFHRSEAALAYRGRPANARLQEYRLQWNVERSLEPVGAARQSHQGSGLGAGLTLKPRAGSRLFLDAGWRRTRTELRQDDVAMQHTDSRRRTGRILLDSLGASGAAFTRAAMWHEQARTTDGARFLRTSVQAGHAREIPTGAGPTLGLEVLAGAGRLSGNATEADRFHGGNPAGQFLSDSPSMSGMLQLPRGPVVRSFGNAQAVLPSGQGGTAYWHLGATLALPIRRWWAPLIPDEPTGLEDATGRPIGLKQMLRTQVDRTAPSMLAATLVSQGLDHAEAQRQAEAALGEVRPAVHFLVDHASLIAVRPLLLVDAAGLSGDSERSRWIAFGAGLSVTIVTARLDVGYMRTVAGSPVPSGRGAAFARIVFQNLF